MNNSISYNRARLLLGMGSVGTWVVISCVLLQTQIQPLDLLFVYLTLSLPFDLLGGQLLPRIFGAPVLAARDWLVTYFRATAVHSSVLVSAGCLLFLAGRHEMLLPMGCVILVGLVAKQEALARLAGTFSVREDSGKVRVVDCQQSEFRGGVTGLPGADRIILPGHWSARVEKTALTRRKRIVARGGRALGVLTGLGWNFAGLAVFGGSTLLTATELSHLSLRLTLWSFLGLLILPRLSRNGVLWADSETLKESGWSAFRIYLNHMTDETEHARPISEPVFYPIPSRTRRLESCQASKPSTFPRPWYPARLALFLSVGSLGLLSRAVHCNAGRPALWFFPPCD